MYSLGEPYALSLDQIMFENYNPAPADHFGGGTWPTGKGTDGGFRHFPISFEPLCNMQGWYTVYNSHSSRPPYARPQQDQESLAWASTLSADMPSQLAFALEPPKYSGPQGVAALGRFNRAAEALKDLLLPDLSGPRVAVHSINATVASGSGSGGAARAIASVYVQQESVGLPEANQSWCAVMVVVNGANAPARIKVSLLAAQVPAYITTAWTMLPFNSYSIPLSDGPAAIVAANGAGGAASHAGNQVSHSMRATRVLEDVVPANGVAHYRLSAQQRNNELGCPRLR